MSSTDMTTTSPSLLAAGGFSLTGAAVSGTKRKAQELGEHALSAVLGDLGSRILSVVVGRYEAHATVDDQVARLHTLVIRVHSAVEAAEGVHIRSWWLRRWLWRLRDAALDGDELLRLFGSRQRRRWRQQQAAGARNTLRNAAAAARALLRSARSLLLPPLLFLSRDDDDPTQRLRRALAALESEAKGLGEFLQLLEMEIRRPPPPQNSGIMMHNVMKKMSCEEDVYVAAGTRDMAGLLIVMRQHIRRALDSLAPLRQAAGKLIRKPPATPPATRAMVPVPDAGELHDLVAQIQRAVDATSHAELRGDERKWLDKWRGELQAVASRAERVLLTLPVRAGPDGIHFVDDDDDDDGREEVRRTAQSVEAAAAHLDDFVTLVRLSRRQMIKTHQTPRRRGGRGIIHPQASSSFFLLSLVLLLLFSLCVAAALLGWRHGWAEVNDRRRALPHR